MTARPPTMFRMYGIYLFMLLFYTALFVFGGFFAHITISRWSLVISFLSYNLILAAMISISGRQRHYLIWILTFAITTTTLLLVFAGIFSRVYDISYDGMFYHQPAVVELASGWDPVYQKDPPIKIDNQFSNELIAGNPKEIWGVEATIFKATSNIESAAALNIVVAIAALTFLYFALREIGVGHKNALIISLLASLNEVFIDQVFSFREDSISYGLFIVLIASAVMLLRGKDRVLYFPCVVLAIILLCGTKYTNVFLLLPVVVFLLYATICYRWYRLRVCHIALTFGLTACVIMLWNPYVTNVERYHTVDYPYNQRSVQYFSEGENIPLNIRKDNRFELFFYGIFSKVDDGDTETAAGAAGLKVPFTTSSEELSQEADISGKTVGGYGILFSGLFILSFLAYFWLVIRKKRKDEYQIVRWLSLSLLIILVGCLLNPTPNYARYNSELALFPICTIVGILLMEQRRDQGYSTEVWLARVSMLVCAANCLIAILCVFALEGTEFSELNTQLNELQSSHALYIVYSPDFYANYLVLMEHGVNIKIAHGPIYCSKPIILDESRGSTVLCKD